ncbi:hypothetical protein [Sulfobacillus sp. hq2]|uniref:hypothetical protein n=1 Tax=Sulfobacillus TaxID=28033 RepID=UPI001304AD27|nr:hypothetical protein [Sulfobacillus sp. hq2]
MMLFWIGLALLALWVIGFFFWHLGTIIYVALLAAIAAFVWHWVSRRAHAREKS